MVVRIKRSKQTNRQTQPSTDLLLLKKLPKALQTQTLTNLKKIKNLKMFENAAGNSVLVRCGMFDRIIGTLKIGASS